MGLLDGQKAVITGAASGIGLATAKRFVEEGASVVLLDINEEAVAKSAAELGASSYAVDVSDCDAVERAFRAAAETLGGLTIAYNNAGVGDQVKLHAMTPQRWHEITRVCLDGVFYGIRAAVPLIRETGGGSIINTSSISGVRPASGEGAYAASKAGVAALTATAALEYAPDIRVNAVAPGMIHTGLTDPLLTLEGTVDFMRDKTPLARIGTPEDVADVVVFLCSPLARFVTGQNIFVDGGMTLHGAGVDGLFDLVTQMFGRPEAEL
jgi:meso-butanediol dehydrogenase/(S,S)-butanediol dehydrogenase/diacetyl reductase